MDKALKKKIFMFSALIGAMLFYMTFFGRKNIAVGIMIIIAAFMNLNEDLSYKPSLSFLKVLGLLLILGIVSYLNSPITIVSCILTFLVVFGTTFSSYHLFRSDVYENRELYNLQFMISNLCNFILSYIDLNGCSDELNKNLLDIIDEDADAGGDLDLKESVIAWSMRHSMDMFKKEKELILV